MVPVKDQVCSDDLDDISPFPDVLNGSPEFVLVRLRFLHDLLLVLPRVEMEFSQSI